MQLDVTRQKGVAKVKSKMATLASDWLKTYLSSFSEKNCIFQEFPLGDPMSFSLGKNLISVVSSQSLNYKFISIMCFPKISAWTKKGNSIFPKT